MKTLTLPKITLDYSNISLVEMAKKAHAGRYDFGTIPGYFSDYSPMRTDQVVFLPRLFSFEEYLTPKEIALAVRADGFRLADIEHLLAVGAAMERSRLSGHIVALNPLVHGNWFFHGISVTRFPGGKQERHLEYEDVYRHDSYFLAIREMQPKS